MLQEKSKIFIMDIETQRTINEVGGWKKRKEAGIAVVSLLFPFSLNEEGTIGKDITLCAKPSGSLVDFDLLWALLSTPTYCVVTFSGTNFDIPILQENMPSSYGMIRCQHYDLLVEIRKGLPQSLQFKKGVSLVDLAKENHIDLKFDYTPSTYMPALWRSGQIEKVVRHCKQDTAILSLLFGLSQVQGRLKALGQQVSVSLLPVSESL